MSDPKGTGDPSTSKIGEAEKASDVIQPGSEKAPEKPKRSPTPVDNPKPEEPIPEEGTKSESEKLVDLASVKAAVDDALEFLSGLKTMGVSSKKARSPDSKGPDPAVEPVESGLSLGQESGRTVPEVPPIRYDRSGVLGLKPARPSHFDVPTSSRSTLPESAESRELRGLCSKFLDCKGKYLSQQKALENETMFKFSEIQFLMKGLLKQSKRIGVIATSIPKDDLELRIENDRLTYLIIMSSGIFKEIDTILTATKEKLSSYKSHLTTSNIEIDDLLHKIVKAICKKEEPEPKSEPSAVQSDRDIAISKLEEDANLDSLKVDDILTNLGETPIQPDEKPPSVTPGSVEEDTMVVDSPQPAPEHDTEGASGVQQPLAETDSQAEDPGNKAVAAKDEERATDES